MTPRPRAFLFATVTVLGLFLATSGSAAADPIAFNFQLDPIQGTAVVNNSLTLTAGSVTLTATAWGYDGGFERARLRQAAAGLGVCNPEEVATDGCAGLETFVDNVGRNDWVLFQFSEPLQISSVEIRQFSIADRDVSYFTGNVTAPVNLTGLAYSQLAGLGFGPEINDNDPGFADDGGRFVMIGSNPVNALLFGATRVETDDDDLFRIATMQADTLDALPVPEPSSTLLLLVGGVGLAAARRRVA